MPSLTIDFFHDVVCCWCFNISSRLRDLAAEFDLDVRHRTFVLQASPAEMAARWGSPEGARAIILGHWAGCRGVSDRPERIDIDAMRAARFDYPHGMTAALGCKAAERLGGQAAHWDMFDRLQRAHLGEARNVADPGTVLRIARDLGFEATAFAEVFDDPATLRAVEADRQHARANQVRSIPALIVRETGARLVNGSREDLAAQLRAALDRGVEKARP
ncbi:MAG: DsbA family protein [Rhodobacter sp.]|uniref:DsbA family oxidoreductase n=1 Tax=Pararhodobacter sp. TaxID=2127056 RepID=UPI001D3CC426|nr:DsbA family protein [Pararhodobacter sp.]MCB1344438.1 DsbA family protein [Paracoccaceae bacterium]MCC0073729.1 DsbA family protein [Rhodobacter sp.]HPD92733.1 DsbA family protein [Pararhodobacter sp.]